MESLRATTYHVVTAVWGTEFIDLYLKVCVPNQLTKGNLESLPPGSRYRILTREADVERLQASAGVGQLRRLMPVDVVAVGSDRFETPGKPGQIRNRYGMMIECHRRAAAQAAVAEAALIYLAPDVVLGEGTFATLVRLHETGVRAVLVNALRIKRAEFIAALSARGIEGGLPPRELVRLAMAHLHPAIESFLVGQPGASSVPVMACWPLRSAAGALEAILVRAFSLHPLLVDPVRRDALPTTTIDHQYLMDCCPDRQQCYVVNDSDELVIFELTPANQAIGSRTRGRHLSLRRLAAVAAGCTPYQRSYWHHAVRLHAGDVDERWLELEAAAAKVTRDLERYLRFGLTLRSIYGSLAAWQRAREAHAGAIAKGGRRFAYLRIANMASRSARRRVERYGDALGKVIRPRRVIKRYMRPVRLWWHRTGKAGRMAVKRFRRARTA